MISMQYFSQIDEATVRFVPIFYIVNEEDLTERVFVELSGLKTAGRVVTTVFTGGKGGTARGKDILGVTHNTISAWL